MDGILCMSTSTILPLRVPIGAHPSKQRPIACRRRRTPIASDLMYGRASDACLVSYDDTYILSRLYFFPVPVFYNISYSYIALAHSDLRTYSTLLSGDRSCNTDDGEGISPLQRDVYPCTANHSIYSPQCC